jgi:hypothetical protein
VAEDSKQESRDKGGTRTKRRPRLDARRRKHGAGLGAQARPGQAQVQGGSRSGASGRTRAP